MRRQKDPRALFEILRTFQTLLRANDPRPFTSLLRRNLDYDTEALIIAILNFHKREGSDGVPEEWLNTIIYKDEIGNYYSLLLIAAKYNEIYALKDIAGKWGANINPPEIPCTALYFAANNNNCEMVQLLVDKYQANVNAGSSIHFAHKISQFDEEWGSEDLIELKLRITHWENFTPLHAAAKRNNVEMAKFLVAAEAEVNTWGLGNTLYESATDLEIRNFLQPYVVIYRSLTAEEVSYEEFVYEPDKDDSAKNKHFWEKMIALSFLELDEKDNASFPNEEIKEKVAEMNKKKKVLQWKQFSIFDLQMAAHKIGEELPERPDYGYS